MHSIGFFGFEAFYTFLDIYFANVMVKDRRAEHTK